jgi:hypothetical protein
MSARSKGLSGLFAFSPWILFFSIAPFAMKKFLEMRIASGIEGLTPIDVGFLLGGSQGDGRGAHDSCRG